MILEQTINFARMHTIDIYINPLLHALIKKIALKVNVTARSLCVIEG
jgi:hypothetical protein